MDAEGTRTRVMNEFIVYLTWERNLSDEWSLDWAKCYQIINRFPQYHIYIKPCLCFEYSSHQKGQDCELLSSLQNRYVYLLSNLHGLLWRFANTHERLRSVFTIVCFYLLQTQSLNCKHNLNCLNEASRFILKIPVSTTTKKVISTSQCGASKHTRHVMSFVTSCRLFHKQALTTFPSGSVDVRI